MKKAFIFSMLLLLAVNAYGQKYNEWEIEDYKKALLSSDGKLTIYAFEEFTAYETGEKYFLCKWKNDYRTETKNISLYAFNKDYEFTEYYLGYENDAEADSETIDILMRGIPGNHLWNTVISIGDFNSDGQDEIASIHFGGAYFTFFVQGIDPYSKEIFVFLETEFKVDWPPTYCPIEFVKYKGMDGFRVRKSDGLINGYRKNRIEFNYPIEGLPLQTWFFYAWNEKERMYIEVGEVNPQYLGDSIAETIQEQDKEQAKAENTAIDDKVSPMPLWAWFAIIGGAVVVVAGGVVFVVKRKK